MTSNRKLPSDNIIAACFLLLDKLKIPFTNTYVTNALKEHPAFPSLLSISDTLDDFKIENASLRIPKDKLTEIEGSFIAHMQSFGGSFAFVEKIEGDNVHYLNGENKWITESVTDFSNKWDGVVLVAEGNEKSEEPGYAENRRKESLSNLRIPFVLGATLLVALAAAWFATSESLVTNWAYWGLLLINLAGIVTSVLLLIQTVDKDNPFTNQICKLNKKTDCNSILQSKAASIFGGLISWSEVGLYYFTGAFIALLLAAISNNYTVITLVILLNLLALPYTIYSVYYQARVAKLWCVLCLIVQGLLLLGAVTGFVLLDLRDLTLNLPAAVIMLVSYLIPVLVWVFIKPFIQKSLQVAPMKVSYVRLKGNSEIFTSYLQTQRNVQLNGAVSSIVQGNPEADFTVTMVTNPYCGPCASAHGKLEELVDKYGEHFKMVTVFTAGEAEDDHRRKVARQMIGIYRQKGKEAAHEAYHDWYTSNAKDFDVWAAKYPIDNNEPGLNDTVESHRKWCDEVHIEFTPTIFVNGYQLPEAYQVDDLKYFIKN
jgi:protein-disulfide isomerase/uncharacterized membrane protein